MTFHLPPHLKPPFPVLGLFMFLIPLIISTGIWPELEDPKVSRRKSFIQNFAMPGSNNPNDTKNAACAESMGVLCLLLFSLVDLPNYLF